MSTTEIFSLKWNDFETNVSKSFVNLRTETQLFDVTLVGQDQKKVSAHRLVLSACSNFLKNILYDNNSHSHPLLYLDGVDSKDINQMLDYMYKGEVKIMQDHLDRFLHISNKFQLEGLLGGEEGNAGSNDYVQKNEEEGDLYQEESFRENTISKIIPKPKKKERSVRVIQDPSHMIDASNVDVTQMYQELIMNEDGQFRCTVCGKTMGHKANMERHVETHMTGLSYDCKHCGETFRSRNILKLHYQKHKRSIGRESS